MHSTYLTKSVCRHITPIRFHSIAEHAEQNPNLMILLVRLPVIETRTRMKLSRQSAVQEIKEKYG